jgi:phage baseplate assembly protein W
MVHDIRNLKAPWQTRVGVTGEVVQGVDALDQLIRTTLGTQLGAVPHRLDLGIDWLSIIDLPTDDATPRLIRGATACFRKWMEPLATLSRIEPVTDGARLTARVFYVPAGATEPRSTEVAP